MSVKEQIALLWQDGYIRRGDALEITTRTCGDYAAAWSEIRKLPATDIEFEYLKKFAKTGDFDFQLARDQFRALWTAYCFHEGLDVDTARYDRYLRDLWDAIPAGSDPRDIDWRDFDAFGNFMCAYLV